VSQHLNATQVAHHTCDLHVEMVKSKGLRQSVNKVVHELKKNVIGEIQLLNRCTLNTIVE